MQDTISISLICSVQIFDPATPHCAIYYINAIVHNVYQVVIYTENKFV